MVDKHMDKPWYHEGLRFKCTGCGECCTAAPGYVWVSPEEIQALAARLNISEDLFIRRYTRRIGNRIALTEDRKSFDCVFLKDKKCEVYNERPQQCRTFPWWRENLSTRTAWKEAAQYCEGINHPDGELIPLSKIISEL